MALTSVSDLDPSRGTRHDRGRDPGRDRTAEIERLRATMQRMQQQAVPGRAIATHPALAGIVRLRAGSAYGVDGNTLALLMLAGPSAAGEWAAVIGVPDFGAEAAAELDVRLERTILVPDPGESWLEALAALVDVTSLVVVRPPDRVPERTAERIGARLRTRGGALVALGAPGTWPRAEAHLSVVEPRWAGVGRGEGFLSDRELVVEVRRGAGIRAVRREPLWLGEPGRSSAGLDTPSLVPREGYSTGGRSSFVPREGYSTGGRSSFVSREGYSTGGRSSFVPREGYSTSGRSSFVPREGYSTGGRSSFVPRGSCLEAHEAAG